MSSDPKLKAEFDAKLVTVFFPHIFDILSKTVFSLLLLNQLSWRWLLSGNGYVQQENQHQNSRRRNFFYHNSFSTVFLAQLIRVI